MRTIVKQFCGGDACESKYRKQELNWNYQQIPPINTFIGPSKPFKAPRRNLVAMAIQKFTLSPKRVLKINPAFDHSGQPPFPTKQMLELCQACMKTLQFHQALLTPQSHFLLCTHQLFYFPLAFFASTFFSGFEMLEIIVTIVLELVKCLAPSTARQLVYLRKRNYNANFENIKAEMEKLKVSANGIIDRAAKFIEDEESTNKRCLKGLSPNWKSRYQLSKKAETEVKAIIELGEEVKKFDTVSSIENALTEANVSIIGVYGMACIGNTTLVKECARQAREKKLFDRVEKLGPELPDEAEYRRASRLYERLKSENKILVILDNIWKHLDLETVGIPFGNNHKGCRLLLTARDNNVLLSMDSKDNFLIGNLTEQEAWRLFKIMNGDDVENCKFKSTAINVFKACGGLPIALRALRSKSLHEWKNALRELRTPSMVTVFGFQTYLDTPWVWAYFKESTFPSYLPKDKDSAEGCKSIPVAILTKPKIDHKVLTMDPPIYRTSSFSSSSSGKTSDSKHVTDLSKANTVIPKPIQWKDVNLPEEWILEGAAPPVIPKQLEPNIELQNVTQYSDDIPSTSIRSVDYTTSVPHPIYTSSQHVQSQEEKEPSPPTSPTFSAVTENVINRKEIQQIYYEFVNYHKVHILFFDWFEIYSSENNIDYPFKESNPITIRKKIPEWKLLDSDRTIESEHPPLRSITIDHGEPPVQIRASPYKIPKPNDFEANLSSIIQQNNFCNTNLNTIGKQLTRIENQFQKSTITISSISPIPSKSDSDKKLKEPIFKPFQVSKTSQKLVQESKSDFAKAIRDQLDRIEAASSSSSKIHIAPDTPQSSKIGVLEHDQMSIASSDIEAFKEEPSTAKANKIHWELALPTIKTPPDLAIDNRPSALNQSRYNASSVYEWNIDGMSEYNILGLLQQMTMAANAYKTQAGTSDRAISEILIAGFTGQLKGWWDHLLTNQQQLDILNSIQVDENGAPILDESNNPIQDAIATLILTISLHFIGNPSHLRDKNAELLHNLRCRKLSEFQSYKTSFFTRLFLRDDANHITWKEKFLAGLPTLLGEKVRNSIKALYDNRIPYDELTYGELVSFVNKEGLKICQDLKLQKRLKWELKKSKQELGGFCKQFNYDPFKTSISKDCNGECSTKPRRKHYKSRHFRKPFRNFRELPYKKPSRPYKKPKFSKKEFKAKPRTPFNYKEAICHKCGIKGHTAKYCRMNKKLHELDLDEEVLSKLAPLLVDSSDSESSMSGDSDPYQVDELFDSEDSASSSSESESDSFLKKINVLTKDQETFLELVKHISDPNLQKEYLDKLLKTLDFNKAETSKVPIVKKNSYDLTQILDKKKTKKLTPTIQDLQKEIKDIKLEIKDLKEK
ncbi:hypothetical protein WN944_006759 [Citrus x changshan-huyou]|uniref:CCHC-type domain-containing protein n=1 Tax=Citrus x changshan-huyou TaxID=2935761 RepID=A0AAP0MPW4_9ROSI